MAEYIDRIALGIGYADPKVFINPAHADGWNTAIQIINEAPAADVAPVVHARWYMRGGRACCSNCNVKSLWGSDWDGCKNHEREFVSAKSNYCPNCGAKMDEEASNDT